MIEFDPRVAAVVGIAGVVASPRVRRTVGRGLGYVAAGGRKAGETAYDTGRDIYESAREVVEHGNGKPASRSKAAR